MRRVVKAPGCSCRALADARVHKSVHLEGGAVPVPVVKIQKPDHKLHQWVAENQKRKRTQKAAKRQRAITCKYGAAEPICTPHWLEAP